METEMAIARQKGLRILYAEGKSPRQLWGYAHTGDYRCGESREMRLDWQYAMEDFDATFPQGATADEVLSICAKWLSGLVMAEAAGA